MMGISKPTPLALALLFLMSGGLLRSQNLVKNPSFESYVHCPERLGNFHDDVIEWSSPTLGSTDYFNGCSTSMGTPKNFNGQQGADFGRGYAGMYLYAPDDYREYIQATLTQSLVKGKKYRLSFYVSLAERSDFAIKEFGVFLSDKKVRIAIRKELSKMHLYKGGDNSFTFMEIGYSNFYSDTQDWILVSTEFVAKGTENYMTIGNFKNNQKTRMFRTKKGAKQGAYYYIDNISLQAAEPLMLAEKGVLVSGETNAAPYALDETHIFNDVLFKFDEYLLLEAAKNELQKMYSYLQSNPDLKISISGHTDNVGTSQYNLSLSKDRCASVAGYLMQLGLPEDRIHWEGHGGAVPVADNTTEAGRQLNRRVEFVISKSGRAENLQ